MKLTILNPDPLLRKALIFREIRATDYIAVGHLDPRVRGTFEMADCMSAESRAKLAILANIMEERVKNERARRRHAGIV